MNRFLERHALAYELQPIEEFALKLLSAFLKNNSEPTTAELCKLKNDLDKRVEKAKAGINHAMLGFKKEYDSRAYIQYNQEALLCIGDHLFPYIHPASFTGLQPPPRVVALSKQIFQAVEELLSFMETFFPEYFDLDAWLPIPYLVIVYHQVSASIADIQSALINLGVDADLLSIVMLPFNRFLNDPEEDRSYRKTANLRRLTKELYYLSHQCTPASVDASLRTLLHTINFNLVEFVDYCTSYQEQLLAETEGSDDEQIHILTRFRKYLERIATKPGHKFDNDRPSLLPELIAWASEGIDNIESSCQAHKVDDAEGVSNQSSSSKIEVDLSTEQLFYLFRVLRAIMLIRSKPGKLTELITRFFRTNRTGDIAGGNVRKKLYSVKDEVKRAVREWLVRAIKFIDQDNGENDTW